MRHDTHKNKAPAKKAAQKPLKPAPGNGDPNEGEGNRTAARHYNDATERYIASGHAGKAAEAAANALDGDEAEALRKAEEEGKAGHPKVNPS
jgi:hypothetical protein